MNRELVEYIHSVSDFPQERVKAALIQHGWSLEQIENAFIQVKHERSVAKTAQADNARIAALTVSFIFIVMLLAPSASVTGKIVYINPAPLVSEGIIVREETLSGEWLPVVDSCDSDSRLEKDACIAQDAIRKMDVLQCQAVAHAHLRDACVSAIRSV